VVLLVMVNEQNIGVRIPNPNQSVSKKLALPNQSVWLSEINNIVCLNSALSVRNKGSTLKDSRWRCLSARSVKSRGWTF